MPGLRGLEFSKLGYLLRRILPQQLMNLVAVARCNLQHRFPRQRFKQRLVRPRHCMRGSNVEASPENGQSAQSPLLIGCKQAPRVVENRAQAAVLRRYVAVRGRQKVEVPLDRVRDLVRRELCHLRRGQLDSEWRAGQQPAYPGYTRDRVGTEREVLSYATGTFNEQLHRAI